MTEELAGIEPASSRLLLTLKTVNNMLIMTAEITNIILL